MAFTLPKLPRDHFWLPKGFTVTPALPDTPPHPESREPFYGRIIIPFAKLWMRRMQHLNVEIQHPERIPATWRSITPATGTSSSAAFPPPTRVDASSASWRRRRSGTTPSPAPR